MTERKISDREKGKINAAKLAKYIRETPPEAVPRNQYRSSKKEQICKELGFSDSAIGSNKRLKRLFAFLDRKLDAAPRTVVTGADAQKVRQLVKENNRLKNRIDALREENRRLQQKQQSSEHFLETGRIIRP